MNGIDFNESLGGYPVTYSGGLEEYPNEVSDLYLYIFSDFIVIKDAPKRKSPSNFFKQVYHTQIAYFAVPKGKMIYNELLINFYENEELFEIKLSLPSTLMRSGVNNYNQIMKLIKSTGILEKFIKLPEPEEPTKEPEEENIYEANSHAIYDVSYLGGLSEYFSEVQFLKLYFMDDSIVVQNNKISKIPFFKQIYYTQITDLQPNTYRVSTSHSRHRVFRVRTDLHVSFYEADNLLCLRLQLASGEVGRKAGDDIMDLIRVKGFIRQFQKAENPDSATNDTILAQIERLAKLHKDHIISDEEFAQEKKQLLDKLG